MSESTNPTHDAPGAAAPAGAVNLDADLARVGSDALAQHFAESPKRGRGRPRKVPLANVGNGAAPGAGPAAGAVGHPPGVVERPIIDEAAIKAAVEGAIGAVNDLAEGLMRSYALTHTRDKELSLEAGKAARMGEKTENMIRAGALGCWRKYLADFLFVEETLLVGGFVLWMAGVSRQCMTIKQRAAPIPPENPENRAPPFQ